MTIEVRKLGLEGVLEILPPKFDDSRGFFSETYNSSVFAAAGIDICFVQDNHSYSAKRGVLRGLHYQLPPAAQHKLLRVVRGSIFDVIVDIRRGSPTFAKWVGLTLSAEIRNQVFIPHGFAHGFITLEDQTEVIYKVSGPYAPHQDRAIRYNDPDIGIDWLLPAAVIQISDKDRSAPRLVDAEVFD
jgi:dTDP-4-dehydrorhamnose 3,5-epimerase